ncbi:MAG TPA: SDR family oxidoreductase [Sphingomicrobium sp.]
MSSSDQPRVLIMGACRGVGRQCAEEFAARGAQLILADIDSEALADLGEQLAATTRYCDVASEASVTVFAADVLAHFPELNMVINAAGGGYERTLGMYRVSRALLPALRKATKRNILLNIPPSEEHAHDEIFPYASSQHAFQRLCAALAAEARGSAVRVLVGHPDSDHLSEVFPDRNAGLIPDVYDLTRHANDEQGRLVAHIVALLYPSELIRRAS